jgi:hypothetical protein
MQQSGSGQRPLKSDFKSLLSGMYLFLAEVNAGPFAEGKSSKQSVAPGAESAIHALAFLRPIIGYLPPAVCFSFLLLHSVLIAFHSRFL